MDEFSFKYYFWFDIFAYGDKVYHLLPIWKEQKLTIRLTITAYIYDYVHIRLSGYSEMSGSSLY